MSITITPTYEDRIQWHYSDQQLKAIQEFIATVEMHEALQGYAVDPNNTLHRVFAEIAKNNAR